MMSSQPGDESHDGGDVSTVQHIDLPPLIKERRVDVPRPEMIEDVVEVPHVQYIERIEEIPQRKIQTKLVNVPKIDVTERIIEIPKHVKDEKIIEVPQVQVVDHVVEVPQYITQQKIVEHPKVLLQERIIPIPKRTIEEKIIEIPEDQYNEILEGRRSRGSSGIGPVSFPLSLDGRPLVDTHRDQRGGYPLGFEAFDDYGSRPVDEVVEIPHVQHIYRNVMQPVYRHVPKPVEVPLTHYKPNPVERIIDRNVPIPVELEVVQEFLCPRILAKYVEVPVPIPVTRVVEKPVPADAMFNSVIMDAYMSGHPPAVAKCTQTCGVEPTAILKEKMNAAELNQAGLSSQPSFSQARSFKSRGVGDTGFNMSMSRDFLSAQRTLQGQLEST